MQNLNNFIIENLNIIILSSSVFLILSVLIILLFRKTGKMRELLLQSQSDLAGRLAALGEVNMHSQNQLFAALNEQRSAVLKIIDEKLLMLTKNVGEGLLQNSTKTNEALSALKERLVKIDVAQQKISSLSEQVVSLQEVLSNKQARGAFGEIQLNDLVTSILPPSVYTFQALLSNGKKADCLLQLPNPPGAIAIDAKFPLESYYALRNATNDKEKIDAERFFRASVIKHIKDISEKYILNGETAESALMFLPSEAIYSLGPVTDSKGEIILDDAGQEISSGIEGELPADLHKFLNGGEYQNAAGELVRFEGVRAALCYLAYARFVRNHSINVTAFGVVQKVGDYSSPIDQELIISASRDAKKIGDEYLSRSMKFWNETHAEPQKPAGRVRRFVSIGD